MVARDPAARRHCPKEPSVLSRSGEKVSLRGSNGATPRRHDEGVSVVYDACNHLPIRTAVDPYAYPTLETDVRRSKESPRVLVDERLLQTRGHCEPDRDVLGAVMMC